MVLLNENFHLAAQPKPHAEIRQETFFRTVETGQLRPLVRRLQQARHRDLLARLRETQQAVHDLDSDRVWAPDWWYL